MINVFYTNKKKNYGDMLTPIIIKWISGQESQHVSEATEGKLLCIGSGLNSSMRKNDIIWGYGSRNTGEFGIIKVPEGVKFLAVRGQWTRGNILKDNPDVKVPERYGDPATLMPEIYQPKSKVKEYEIGLISHYIDQEKFKVEDPRILNINVLTDPLGIIDKINQCEVVVSTSLHGTITAEAYGVPVVWLKVSNKVLGAHFKFNDYFSGTNRREQFPVIIKKQIVTGKDIFEISKNVLPKPTINTEPLKKAWREYYDT